jgi:hypothetical protein
LSKYDERPLTFDCLGTKLFNCQIWGQNIKICVAP